MIAEPIKMPPSLSEGALIDNRGVALLLLRST